MEQRQLPHRRHPRSDPAGGLPSGGEARQLRPRAHPGARRARARRQRQGLLRGDPRRLPPHLRRLPARPRRADARHRALLHRDPRAREPRDAPRPARVRRQVLHPGGQLGPRRQQLPRLLHPRRHEVPGHGARAQAQPQVAHPGELAHPRLLLPPPGEPAHVHLPLRRRRHPRRLPPHGRLRRQHLHARQPRRQGPLRQVPLAPHLRRQVPARRRGRHRRRRQPQPRHQGPLRRHRRRELPRVDALHPDHRPGPRGPLRLRPARRHQDLARGPAAAAARGPHAAQPQHRQLLRRERAARLLPGHHRAGHLLLRRQAAADQDLLLLRHAAPPPGTQLPAAPGQRAQVRAPQQPLRRIHELHAPRRGGGLLPVQVRPRQERAKVPHPLRHAQRPPGEDRDQEGEQLQATRGEIPLHGPGKARAIHQEMGRRALRPPPHSRDQEHLALLLVSGRQVSGSEACEPSQREAEHVRSTTNAAQITFCFTHGSHKLMVPVLSARTSCYKYSSIPSLFSKEDI